MEVNLEVVALHVAQAAQSLACRTSVGVAAAYAQLGAAEDLLGGLLSASDLETVMAGALITLRNELGAHLRVVSALAALELESRSTQVLERAVIAAECGLGNLLAGERDDRTAS